MTQKTNFVKMISFYKYNFIIRILLTLTYIYMIKFIFFIGYLLFYYLLDLLYFSCNLTLKGSPIIRLYLLK